MATIGAVAIIEGGIVVAGLLQIVEQLLQRGPNMEHSDWFCWSDGTGFWNGFGDVGANFINPSIVLSDPFASHDSRIGVVFSNVALDQGPDFAFGSAPAACAAGHSLGRRAGEPSWAATWTTLSVEARETR